ncbi:NAD-P-binding protein [Laetiporus sulphureus 93-53]|uniref:NAD-P-binding protein n=1 Tax=Laetiporus sulphureus 93-53 TaxID=1314785 RepID=A0A165E8H3_9APHY|nr:NAD-P-binding protein [Laetiporus sulphureus 93-53]KZT06459.1 NAD-P-binding protein [Laetiporus sulphureus 93-53]
MNSAKTFLETMVPGLLSVSRGGWDSMLPPSPKWSTDQIPDLSGKVIIVTGGNVNIGRKTVKGLLEHNAKVYMACRNEEKARETIEQLRQETGHEAIYIHLDLADLRSIKTTVNEFLRKETQLHVLFNNAASMYPPVEDLTADGYDLQFGTNVLGHFYLTKLLLSILFETAKSSVGGKPRVVHVASVGHEFVSGLDFETFKDCPKRREMNTVKLYFQSKFGNVVVANEFHRRYAEQGLVSFSLHPGNLKYDTARNTRRFVKFLSVINPVLPDAEIGALTQLWGGTAPEGAQFGGKYLIPWARVGKAKPETDNLELGQKLWAWLEEQVKDLDL